MSEQLKFFLQRQLADLQNQRAAAISDFDAKIADIQKQLGIEPETAKKPTPAQEFQAERDSKPNPFAER